MAISSAFLTTVRAAIVARTEYTNYTDGLAVLDAASEPDKLAKWAIVYDDAQIGGSLAMKLKRAIREVIAIQDLSALSVFEREEVFRTMAGSYLRDDDKPRTATEDVAALAAAGISE